MTATVDRIDLWNPELFRNGVPHEVFDRLRQEAPVYWNVHEEDRDGGFWVLTRYADVLAASQDTEHLSAAEGHSAPRMPLDRRNPAFFENIMFRDPPDHTLHRRLISPHFTPKTVAGLEDQVRAVVLKILDEVRTLDEFDWVRMIAAELPARVVALVIGVDEADHGKFVEWATNTFGRDGTPEADARWQESIKAIMAYAETFKAAKRACPVDDVMSALVQSKVSGEPLSEAALTMWFLTLTGAGFETTHTLIAQSMVLLSQRPELRERLMQDRGAIPSAIEELLRFITPVHMMGRTALEDFEFNGQLIRAGQYVTMYYAAANRDPEVFDSPHEFNIDRSPNQHLSFGGYGSVHYCLGSHLARLEMKVLLEELAERGFPYELAGPVKRGPGVYINALTHVPVRKRGTLR